MLPQYFEHKISFKENDEGKGCRKNSDSNFSKDVDAGIIKIVDKNVHPITLSISTSLNILVSIDSKNPTNGSTGYWSMTDGDLEKYFDMKPYFENLDSAQEILNPQGHKYNRILMLDI